MQSVAKLNYGILLIFIDSCHDGNLPDNYYFVFTKVEIRLVFVKAGTTV